MVEAYFQKLSPESHIIYSLCAQSRKQWIYSNVKGKTDMVMESVFMAEHSQGIFQE